ncbi:MAG: sigma-70 family RNA polymerase sigma factor [Myxococcales bacterium]|nr:sigma-70 family RNA polymerase sigma factor [Myxococcales bacterium]
MLSTAERDALVEKHLDYARALAAKLRTQIGGHNLDLEELQSLGYSGLVEAAQRFDPTRGAAFTTFAYYRVRGAIFDGLRKSGWLSSSEYARYLDGANALLENSLERDPAASASSGGDTKAKLHQIADALDNVATIFVACVDAGTLEEIGDPNAASPDEAIDDQRKASAVREALQTLPDKERQLLQMVYYRGLSMVDAGKKMGLSKSWASRLHARAISLLTKRVGRAFNDP